VEIISYIQRNYQDVTLDTLASEFHLSKPYLSKYIREKSGATFQDVVRMERMKKARTLLKETTHSVESIATEVGYENVEHFNRLFKKSYNMTPVQYRKS
jgi:2-isopropylmalate synthase